MLRVQCAIERVMLRVNRSAYRRLVATGSCPAPPSLCTCADSNRVWRITRPYRALNMALRAMRLLPRD